MADPKVGIDVEERGALRLLSLPVGIA